MHEDFCFQMKNIEKEYYGNKVLKGVNMTVKSGEVHALIGENGAGKSTLMNILFGMPVISSTGGYSGEILINEKPVEIKSPEDAMNLGIGMVHQEFMLIPGFDITENVKLNREITKPNVASRFLGPKLKTLDFEMMDNDARKDLDRLNIDVKETKKISELPIGYMQFTEIAREIDKEDVRLIIFDEPTAVLTEGEAESLLSSVKRLAESGIAILFITHKLDEVMEIADNITVLKDGTQIVTVKKEETSVIQLAELMVGRKIERIVKDRSEDTKKKIQTPIMTIKDFHVKMPGEEIKGVNIDIKDGEILGIGGLGGQGKIGLANGVIGLYPASGEICFKGKKLKLNNPNEMLKNGIVYVSEDRKGVGLLLDSSIEMNIAVTALKVKGQFLKSYGLFSQINQKEIREHALKMIKELDIRCTSPKQVVKSLSGGNQQKVCIAKALTMKPEILFISEPTRGIDIGAKKLILSLLVKLNEETGMTIVMTSSELSELKSVCDRIAIISGGKIEGILSPEDSDADYGLMMSGQYHKMHNKEVM